METTLIIIKPDAVSRGLIGAICSRIENKGLIISSLAMSTIPKNLIEGHYSHHADKPFFNDLVSFMTGGASVLMRVKGIDAVDVMRTMCGATNGRVASPGTIRGEFSQSNQLNLIHASDSLENAAIEIKRFSKIMGAESANARNITSVCAGDEI